MTDSSSSDPDAPRGPDSSSPLSPEGQALVDKIKWFLSVSRGVAYAATGLLAFLKLSGRIDSGWLVVLSPLMVQILISVAVSAWFGFVVAPREIEKMHQRDDDQGTD